MKTQFAPSIPDLYCSDPLKACQLALRKTAHLPENDRLKAINTMLGMHGTEPIRGEWQNGYWCDIVAAYCNTGDTYALTVLQVRPDSRFGYSRFIISSMGDFLERNSEKYGIQ